MTNVVGHAKHADVPVSHIGTGSKRHLSSRPDSDSGASRMIGFSGLVVKNTDSLGVAPSASKMGKTITEPDNVNDGKAESTHVLWQQHLLNVGMNPEERPPLLPSEFLSPCSLSAKHVATKNSPYSAARSQPQSECTMVSSPLLQQKSQEKYLRSPQQRPIPLFSSAAKDRGLEPMFLCSKCKVDLPPGSTQCSCGGIGINARIKRSEAVVLDQAISTEPPEKPHSSEVWSPTTKKPCVYCKSSDPSKSGVGLICPLCGGSVHNEGDPETNIDADRTLEDDQTSALVEAEIRDLQQVPNYKIPGCRVRQKQKDQHETSIEFLAWDAAVESTHQNSAAVKKAETPKILKDVGLHQNTKCCANVVSDFNIDISDIEEINRSQRGSPVSKYRIRNGSDVCSKENIEVGDDSSEKVCYDLRSDTRERTSAISNQVYLRSGRLLSPTISPIKKRVKRKPSFKEVPQASSELLPKRKRGRPRKTPRITEAVRPIEVTTTAEMVHISQIGEKNADVLTEHADDHNKHADVIMEHTDGSTKHTDGSTKYTDGFTEHTDDIPCVGSRDGADEQWQCQLIDTTIDLLSQSNDSPWNLESSKGHISIQSSSDTMDRSYEIIGEEYPRRIKQTTENTAANEHPKITPLRLFRCPVGRHVSNRPHTPGSINIHSTTYRQATNATGYPRLRHMSVPLNRVKLGGHTTKLQLNKLLQDSSTYIGSNYR